MVESLSVWQVVGLVGVASLVVAGFIMAVLASAQERLMRKLLVARIKARGPVKYEDVLAHGCAGTGFPAGTSGPTRADPVRVFPGVEPREAVEMTRCCCPACGTVFAYGELDGGRA